MKKIFLIIGLAALGVSLWVNLRNTGGISIGFLTGKTARLNRGDLTIPITANGTIEPKERVDIKSEAGGVVLQTPFQVGSMVQEGELLVLLDPEDETRMVDIAEKAFEQGKINLQRSQNSRYQREFVDLPAAAAVLEASKADLTYWQWKVEMHRSLNEKGATDRDEYRQYQSRYQSLLAERSRLEAELDRANKNIELADLDVRQAELAMARAQDDLRQAQNRLRETKIEAPTSGMLSRLLVQKGTVVASGSASFGGGTLLAMLSDISELYVRAQVDESDIGRVREIAPERARPGNTGMHEPLASAGDDLPIALGTPVKVTVEAFPEDQFTGTIDLIEPEPDRGQVVVTYVVRIRLISDNAAKLMLGMQANVEFVSKSVNNVVLVPNEAVRIVAGRHGVYLPVPSVRHPDKQFPQFQAFRPGLDNGAYTEAVEGLTEGQEVYISLPKDRRGQEITGEPKD